MKIRQIVYRSIISGSVAALAMMPFGFAFRAAGLRVGHYGPKFASLFLDNPGPKELFVQHIVLGWLSALPLVVLFMYWRPLPSPIALGAIYGIAYYVMVNSLALPLYFGDELPWVIGLSTIIPSLVTHIIFGMVVGVFFGKTMGKWRAA